MASYPLRGLAMNRITAFGSAVVAACVLGGPANAAVFTHLLLAHARSGQLVDARVDYWTASTHPPLYLVPASFGTFSTSTGAPEGRPYLRLVHIEWSSPATGTSTSDIRFRVPRVRPGRYRLAIYCEPCIDGPIGSVIASDNTIRIR